MFPLKAASKGCKLEEWTPSKKSSYTFHCEGIELFKRVSILKLGPLIGRVKSGLSGAPKSIVNSTGLIISSAILQESPSFKLSVKGSNNFINIKYCFELFLSRAAFIPIKLWLSPNDKRKSL